MKYILGKVIEADLMKRLRELEGSNIQGLDKESFRMGYTNGYGKGIYFTMKMIPFAVMGLVAGLALCAYLLAN